MFFLSKPLGKLFPGEPLGCAMTNTDLPKWVDSETSIYEKKKEDDGVKREGGRGKTLIQRRK